MKPRIILGLKDNAQISDVISKLNDNPRINATQLSYNRLHQSIPIVNEFLQKEGINSIDQIASKGKEKELLSAMSDSERRLFQTYLIEVEEQEQVGNLLEELRLQNEYIDYVELDKLNYTTGGVATSKSESANDPLKHRLYGLELLECEKAWEISKGNSIIVAIIDTGVDYSHPDIQANMWKDENGNHGYNAINQTYDPMDDNGHGTHVAGTVASIGNNNIGIVGVAPEAKIMAVKGLDFEGKGYDSTLAECILYAAFNKAKVINNSWGRGDNQVISNAIDEAHRRGSVVVFAAGNDNEEVKESYAAGKTNTISVSAVDQFDTKTSFSNHGSRVDVSAPGYNILSLKNGGGNLSMNGTSMAAPHVSGLIALLLAKDPDLNFDSVKEIITNKDNVDDHFKPANIYIGKGRVNANKCLTKTSNAPDPEPNLKPKPTPKPKPIRNIEAFRAKLTGAGTYSLVLEVEGLSNRILLFDSITELKAVFALLSSHKASIDETDAIVIEGNLVS